MQFGFGNSHVESLKGDSSFWGHMVGGEMKILGYANIVVFPELVKATKFPCTM
jgi:hypothetical protein